MKGARRAAALLEVFGVYVAGNLLVVGTVRPLGAPVRNPLNSLTADITDAQLLTAAWQMLVVLVIQYARYSVLVIPIDWWHAAPRIPALAFGAVGMLFVASRSRPGSGEPSDFQTQPRHSGVQRRGDGA